MSLKSIATLPALALLLSGLLHAVVQPNPLFTDGAVLQRGQPIPVWGTANDGEKITVEFENQKVTTTAAHGKWSVELTTPISRPPGRPIGSFRGLPQQANS